jgi:hypothetical protein
MKKVMKDIYPKELVLIPEGLDNQGCSFLDLKITIKNNIISTSIFDKRDSYDFPIVNFPFLCGNIPQRSSYGVFIGELVRYARVCTYLKDFRTRMASLVSKLKTQCFTDQGLKRAFRKFCDSHVLLIQKYGKHILSLYDDIVAKNS